MSYSPVQIAVVRSRYQGLSTMHEWRQLARQTGISSQADLHALAHELGLERRRRRRPQQLQKSLVRWRYRRCRTLDDKARLARQCGMTVQKIYNLASRFGLTTHPHRFYSPLQMAVVRTRYAACASDGQRERLARQSGVALGDLAWVWFERSEGAWSSTDLASFVQTAEQLDWDPNAVAEHHKVSVERVILLVKRSRRSAW